jgi:hypothetical protein
MMAGRLVDLGWLAQLETGPFATVLPRHVIRFTTELAVVLRPFVLFNSSGLLMVSCRVTAVSAHQIPSL